MLAHRYFLISVIAPVADTAIIDTADDAGIITRKIEQSPASSLMRGFVHSASGYRL
jgi:hypothetical protein